MKTLNRRQLLGRLGAAGILSSTPLSGSFAAEPAQPSFDFLFVTDSHIEPELNAAAGTAAAFRKAKTFHADFVIQGGDHVFDAGAVDKQRALSLFDLYTKTEQELGMKVYNTIGNHDLLGILGSTIPADDPLYGKRLYEERFGKTYYSFNHKGCHFVVLDSIRPIPQHGFDGFIDDVQLKWLKADLALLTPGTPSIVVSHIPIVTAIGAYIPITSPIRKYLPLLSLKNSTQVIDVLSAYNVIAVLQGHNHVNETVLWKGIPYITGGAVCGNWWHGSYLGCPEGFTVVSVAGNRVTTRYETYGFRSVDPAVDYKY